MAGIAKSSLIAPLGVFPPAVQAAPADTLGKEWPVSPWVLIAVILVAGCALAIWLLLERRMEALRQRMRLLNRLGEEIVAAPSALDILTLMNNELPKISADLQAVIYLHNRASRTLDKIAESGLSTASIQLDAPEGGIASGATLCFRNRTLLAVPDTRNSPFFTGEQQAGLPRSVMFIPMFGPKDLLGVVQIHHLRQLHDFSQDEQTAMQHLANQAGTSLRLQEQKSIRERLFRTERLAATGQLIAGIAGELRAPLDAIVDLTTLLVSSGVEDSRVDLIRSKALGASEIVTRLIAFGNSESIEAKPVQLHAMLSRLLHLRAEERKTRGVEIRTQYLEEDLTVLGSREQLEQAFLHLIVHAEQAASEAQDSTMLLSTNLMARRVLVEVEYNAPLDNNADSDPFEAGFGGPGPRGLGICRGVVHSHGGELRFIRIGPTRNRFEVELPIMEEPETRLAPRSEGGRAARRPLTVLVVEPEAKTQKQILEMLSKRGERVITVSCAEEAADLAQRLYFDLTICSVRLPGLNWVELFERVRRSIGAFVLVTPGYDPDLIKAFENGDGYVIHKPIDGAQLATICDSIVEKANAARTS